MPFQPGDRVGAYEILSTLGAGGMGVVYRARDGKLGREVAIKTLPEEVAADGERLARFEREARALAALNHVNVASIYGFEQAGSGNLLVMELVEGETLADWIARGPIPVERALPLFLQIAAGLEAAHAKGIIHRDLKPANIKIASSGSMGSREIKPGAVKILDFGLAKALAPEAPAQAVGASHSPSASGALAYVHSGTAARNVLVWVDREGREEPLGAPPRPYGIPRLSPDGTRIALAFDPVEDIWIWELERETMTRLDVSPGIDDSPVWSPDGRTVFHSSELASGGWEIVARNADGSGDPVRISEHRTFLRPLTVTADGAGLVTLRAVVSRYPPYDVVLLDIAGKAEPKVLLDEDWSFFSAELSPDGRFLAYTSNESGSDEVFVSPFPRLDSHRWQVSSGGGSWPRWSPDGTEIFFLDDRDYLTAVPVTTREGTLEFGRSKVLFETAYYSSWFGRPYDVSPDGRRFLMIKVPAADGELSGRIVYVQNWFDELRRLAPARR